MFVNSLDYQSIKTVMAQKEYKFYTDPFDMNLIGIRTKDNTTNKFNDFLCTAFIDRVRNPLLYVFPATTDPGLFWLNTPENPMGTAILKPGQYRSCWKVGLHRGQYRALVQVKEMTVYRDNNRDNNLDLIPGSEDTGLFGINYHHAGQDSQSVDKWSAGCQVFQKLFDFTLAMEMVDKQIAAGLGDVFSYTLLTEADFTV